MNLLTTLPIVVTKKPFSRHKYSVPQTVPRADALKDKPPTRTETTPFVITYNLTLPYVAHIIHKHSHVLYSSERCRNVFKNLPIVSYRRSNNLSHILVRVQLPETDNCNNARATPGSFRCNSRDCTTCAYIDHARPWQLYFLLYGWNLQNQISHYLQYFQCYLHDSMPPLYKICNILGKPNATSRTVLMNIDSLYLTLSVVTSKPQFQNTFSWSAIATLFPICYLSLLKHIDMKAIVLGK